MLEVFLESVGKDAAHPEAEPRRVGAWARPRGCLAGPGGRWRSCLTFALAIMSRRRIVPHSKLTSVLRTLIRSLTRCMPITSDGQRHQTAIRPRRTAPRTTALINRLRGIPRRADDQFAAFEDQKLEALGLVKPFEVRPNHGIRLACMGHRRQDTGCTCNAPGDVGAVCETTRHSGGELPLLGM